MKILHITHSYWPAAYFGGPIFSTLGLCEALASVPDVELRVLSTDAAGPSVGDRISYNAVPTHYHPGYEVYFVKQTARNFAPRQMPWIWSLMKWSDCILLTGTYSFHVVPSLAFAGLLQKPTAWSPRGALLDSHKWVGHRRPFAKRVYEQVCRFVAGPHIRFVVTSPEEAEASCARVGGIPATIVSNGISFPPELPKRHWRPNGKLRLMSIGRLDPKKGLENLISAMALLGGHISLDIYGRGEDRYEDNLKRLSVQREVSDRVHFRGHVDGARKTAAFAESDLFVLPTHSENFAMVVAEALAHGVPAIVSHGAPWPQITEKGAGVWVSNATESIADAIRGLDECDLRAMGERGREWMRNDFSWDARASELLSMFNVMTGCSDTTTPL